MAKLYKDYFDIDPKYYSSVTKTLIEQGEVDWKHFYPHDTFMKLLETTYRVLSGAASRSIWVEGSYGSGKSYAALTLKCMLDAPDSEVEAYFNDYGLRQDLRDKLISVKNSGKILTIHRVGSAGIDTDLELILAVQQSIMAALRENGIEHQGDAAMKDAFLSWVSDSANRAYFDALISKDQYVFKFGGMNADTVVNRLTTGTADQIESMMSDVMTVLKEAGQFGLLKDVNSMADWIKSVIDENQLSAIVFVWDEFSEYFLTHPVALTGFQTLIEISESHPFYFVIVAHMSDGLFSDSDTRKKTLDRFEPPVKIELPDNMAFRLMAQAMKENSDPVVSKIWQKDKAALNDELVDVRNVITTSSRRSATAGPKTMLSDTDLQGIVPIHPYAALVLKYIATVFHSNQRSMFDFIKNNDMEGARGFQWYINHFGPEDDQYLLTIDLLWDFFYGKEQSGLNDDVRGVLDNYRMLQSDRLFPEEQRVLKTVLLLQAISLRATGNDLLIPNDQNVDLAYSGTEWSKGRALAIANGLIDKKILFRKPIGGGKFEFTVASLTSGDNIEPHRRDVIKETRTQSLIVSGGLMDAIVFPDAIRGRFLTEGTGYNSISSAQTKLNAAFRPERFKVVVTFAMDDTEAQQIRQHILKTVNSPGNDFLFIETLTPMGADLYNRYVDNMAFSRYFARQDKDQARHYQNQAAEDLKEWQSKISHGAFMLYTPDHKSGSRKADLSDLQQALRDLNRKTYYYGLEQYALNSTMYGVWQLPNGALCGITETLTSAYKNSNVNMSFETALKGAWKVDKYWEDPDKQNLTIVHIKKRVMEIVDAGFNSGAGEVSISAIWDELERAPFGFMPSSVAALVMGFVLKEYVKPEYFWSDHSNSGVMDAEKMKNMIAATISERVNHAKNYREPYIRIMSPQLRSFLTCTQTVFRIPAAQCSSVESARDQVRLRMKGFDFPIWCIKYSLNDEQITSSKELIEQVIDRYTGIANTANSSKATANESSLAEEIGSTVINRPEVVADLSHLMTSEQCRKGMLGYISIFRDGILPELASKIGDGGNYLSEVKKKFSASDANWVWSVSTADERISDVILEYQIIAESNKSLPKSTSLRETINAWNARTNQIRIPYEAVAKSTGDLGPFLRQLYFMKQSNVIQEQHKQEFYDLLLTQRENFDRFYRDQLPYFVQDAGSFLGDMDTEDIAELYAGFPTGQFTKSKSDYYKFVQSEIEKFQKSQWRKRLRDFWFAKTKTKDPVDWSEKFETPILCMFNDSERPAARANFRIISSSSPAEKEAQAAMDFLEHASFYDTLNDEAARNKCFMERIVGSYSVLLHDVSAIRRELVSKAHDRVYDWMDNSSIRNILAKMFERQYKLTGCDHAMDLIEKMDAEALRKYLRDRIMDDPEFGMQILKGESGESD